MKFFRLTSVFLCCALLSSFLILPASATDDDDFYSLPSVGVSDPSLAVEWPVSPAVDGFTSTDSRNLADIKETICDYAIGSFKWYFGHWDDALYSGDSSRASIWSATLDILKYVKRLDSIYTQQGSILSEIRGFDSSLSEISTNTGGTQRNTLAIADRVLDSNSLLGSINSAVSGIHGYATERTLASLLASSEVLSGDVFNPVLGSISTKQPGYAFPLIKDREYAEWMSFPWVISSLYSNFSYDGFLPYHNAADEYTLYHWVKNLSQTLASEDDKKLAESQKENREQIEKDFLTGKSGKTSLGKDDFGSLSSVGGTFKDAISLNGQSSISDLTSGLSDADTAGQGWFSQATKDSLDAVSGSTSSESTVSTFSDDGLYSVDVDPDPYHMQGFEDNYAWLWGDD